MYKKDNSVGMNQEDKMNYIYCYTNKINGHKYVGKTNNLERRKIEHRSSANNPLSKEYNYLFHRKLREYGEENFIFSVLQKLEDSEDINKAECFWIEQLKAFVGDNQGGYNLTRGGEEIPSICLYEENIQEIKTAIKNKIPFDKIKQKYGISISYISAINHGMYYRENNETYPLCKYYKDKDEINYIKELLINSSISMKELAKQLGISYSTIKKINSGSLWKDDKIDYPLRKISSGKQRAIEIQKMLLNGASNEEIIAKTNVSTITVRRINNGESYKDNSLHYPLRLSL